MLAIKTSPTKSESSSTSKADDTSSSAYPVSWLYSNPVVDLQSPKRSSADLIRDQKEEESPPSLADESFEEEYSGPYPKPKPGYTCRLIPIIRVPADEIDENFDEDAWNKKVYGPDVIVVDMHSIPKGWILVDGSSPAWNACLLLIGLLPRRRSRNFGILSIAMILIWKSISVEHNTRCRLLMNGILVLSILTEAVPNISLC